VLAPVRQVRAIPEQTMHARPDKESVTSLEDLEGEISSLRGDTQIAEPSGILTCATYGIRERRKYPGYYRKAYLQFAHASRKLDC
jgi:hypothetical protein